MTLQNADWHFEMSTINCCGLASDISGWVVIHLPLNRYTTYLKPSFNQYKALRKIDIVNKFAW